MNRRLFLQSSSAAAFAAVTSGQAHAAEAARATGRPNFLFLIADDLTYRSIGGVNNPKLKTPTLDRLVKHSCHFSHCFHQGSWLGAVCVASRTMLNTGQPPLKSRLPSRLIEP